MAGKGLGRGLGKDLGSGLGALFGDAAEAPGDFEYAAISRVEPRQDQPRTVFSEPELQELADSIAEHGIIQPLTVRRIGDGYYQIIAGERRWRAARLAGLTQVPVRIITADDMKATELAMVENLQREGLGAIEEAKGYRMLMQEYGMTQEQVAQRVSKSRPVIANALRLLTLPEKVIDMIEDGSLAPGAARALISLEDERLIIKAAETVVGKKLSVREAEQLVKRILKENEAEEQDTDEVKVNYLGLVEEKLTRSLGRKVKVSGGKRKGRIEIEFYDMDDFENLCSALDSMKIKKETKR